MWSLPYCLVYKHILYFVHTFGSGWPKEQIIFISITKTCALKSPPAEPLIYFTAHGTVISQACAVM